MFSLLLWNDSRRLVHASFGKLRSPSKETGDYSEKEGVDMGDFWIVTDRPLRRLNAYPIKCNCRFGLLRIRTHVPALFTVASLERLADKCSK